MNSFKLILASASPYRAKLLARLDVPFKIQAANIDEKVAEHENPHDYVERMSKQKAAFIAKDYQQSWVIGSDQAAVFEGEIIGKPGNHANAVKQLQQFSGKQVQFISGIYLQNHQLGVGEYQASITQVYFKSLDRQTIENYLSKDQPYDCAGSFKVESLGILLFDKIINDDPTALEGLPLIALHQLFNRCGVQLLEKSQE